MTTKQSSFISKQRKLWAGLALTAFAAVLIAAPPAEAVVTDAAGTTILNTVTVSYKDASNTIGYTAVATASVTINQVKAALTISGKPVSGFAGILGALPAPVTTDSGLTATYVYALTSNANGGDNYNLSVATGTLTNINGSATVTTTLVQPDGSTAILSPPALTEVPIGASYIVANTAGAAGSATISIPGGSNSLAAKLQTTAAGYKVVVINGIDYAVTGIVTGHAASNLNNSGWQTTGGSATTEQPDVITIGANTNGSNTSPNAITLSSLVGKAASEQILVKITVTATVGAAVATDGLVPVTVTANYTGEPSPVPVTVTTTYKGSNIQIRKTVRNCGNSITYPVGSCAAGVTGFAATSTGNPGDVLEYMVEVNNIGGSSASSVSVLDNVPVYTTLIGFSAAYGNGGSVGATNFSTVFDGIATATITMAVDADNNAVGSGDVAALTASTPMHFYIGTGNVGTVVTGGGAVAATKTYTILYRVKVN